MPNASSLIFFNLEPNDFKIHNCQTKPKGVSPFKYRLSLDESILESSFSCIPRGVTIQMKALDEYSNVCITTVILKRVHFLANF